MFSVGKKKPLAQESVTAALMKVQAPLVGKDLVTLKLVKGIAIDGSKVAVSVLFTTPTTT